MGKGRGEKSQKDERKYFQYWRDPFLHILSRIYFSDFPQFPLSSHPGDNHFNGYISHCSHKMKAREEKVVVRLAISAHFIKRTDNFHSANVLKCPSCFKLTFRVHTDTIQKCTYCTLHHRKNHSENQSGVGDGMWDMAWENQGSNPQIATELTAGSVTFSHSNLSQKRLCWRKNRSSTFAENKLAIFIFSKLISN